MGIHHSTRLQLKATEFCVEHSDSEAISIRKSSELEMALLNKNEYKWKKMSNLFGYTMIARSLCLGFVVVETILAPLYKQSPGDALQNCSAMPSKQREK